MGFFRPGSPCRAGRSRPEGQAVSLAGRQLSPAHTAPACCGRAKRAFTCAGGNAWRAGGSRERIVPARVGVGPMALARRNNRPGRRSMPLLTVHHRGVWHTRGGTAIATCPLVARRGFVSVSSHPACTDGEGASGAVGRVPGAPHWLEGGAPPDAEIRMGKTSIAASPAQRLE